MAEGGKPDRIATERLNRRIAVVRAVTAHDGYEPVAGVLQRLCWRRASLKSVRRTESFVAGGVEAQAEVSAWLRCDAVSRTIRATDKVVVDGRLFEITAEPVEIGLGYALELLLVAEDGQTAIDANALDPVA